MGVSYELLVQVHEAGRLPVVILRRAEGHAGGCSSDDASGS